MMKVTTILVVILASAAALANPRWSLADRTRLERALSAREHVASAAELQRLHPAAEQILIDIARFPSRRALAHTRALAVLRQYRTAAVAAVLRQVINRCANRVQQRRRAGHHGELPMSLELLNLKQALTSYAAVKGPAALAQVRPYLAYNNRDVRAAAAVAVVASRSPMARQVLRSRQKVERQAMVRHAIRRQLELLRRGKRTHTRLP